MGVCFHKLLASVPISRYELLVVELASESPAAQSHVHSIEGHFLSYHVGASSYRTSVVASSNNQRTFNPSGNLGQSIVGSNASGREARRLCFIVCLGQIDKPPPLARC
jgi:hypothetical protein